MSGHSLRFPSLDGLRAVSILAVLFGHAVGTQGFPLRYFEPKVGELGVRVFFVISGFLITSLLLAEQRKHGTISLPRFYFRRAFRIFPAFYVMVAAVAVLAWQGAVVLADGDLLAAVTYTTNYHSPRAYTLNHLWSLAVEEQFYLLWPAALALLGVRRGLWAAAFAAALVPLLRMMTLRGMLPGEAIIQEAFHTVADSLAIGCLLAGLRQRLEANAWYQRLLRPGGMVMVAGFVVVSSLFHRWPAVDLIGTPLSNLAIAVMLHGLVLQPSTLAGRVLNWGPVAHVGTLSYSLYLWQQVFLNPKQSHWFASFPVNLGLAVACGIASYYIVERPMLALRDRLLAKGQPTA